MNTRVKIAILCVMVAVVVGLLLLDWKAPPQKGTARKDLVERESSIPREGEQLTRGSGETTVGPIAGEHDPIKTVTTEPSNPVADANQQHSQNPVTDAKGVQEFDIGGAKGADKGVGAEPAGTTPAQKKETPKPIYVQPESKQYVVQEGDSYYKIAKKVYGDGNKADVIAKANPLFPANRLKVKATLTIPPLETKPVLDPVTPEKPQVGGDIAAGSKTYKVQENDSYWKIAEKVYGSGSKYQKIVDANKDKVAAHGMNLKSGWVINLPE